MFEKKPKLNFNEYTYSLSNEQRVQVLKYCAQFGDANQVLCGLLDTPPCYQTKKDEYRINKDFLLWHFIYNSRKYFSIKKIDSIAYCYHSYDNCGSRIGLIFNDGSLQELLLNNEYSVAVFTELQRYVHGFENLKTHDPFSQPDVILPSPDGVNFYYMIKGNALYCVRSKLFSRKTEERIEIPDIRDAVWCNQFYFTDSDLDNDARLYIYLCNQKKPIYLSTDTERDAFSIAMELKKRVPHLMYGPNKAYEEIFNRNPNELMYVAKNLGNK